MRAFAAATSLLLALFCVLLLSRETPRTAHSPTDSVSATATAASTTPAPASPAPPKGAVLTAFDLHQLAKRNAACEIADGAEATASAEKSFLRFLDAMPISEAWGNRRYCVKLLVAPDHPDARAWAARSEDPACALGLAAITGDFLEAVVTPDGPKGDPEAALAMLERLRRKDPGNGYYPFLELPLLEKLGQRKELDAMFTAFLRAPRFQNPAAKLYYTDLLREASRSEASMVLATLVAAGLRGAETSYASKVVRELGRDARYGPDIAAWSRRIEGRFDRMARAGKVDPDVGLLEWSVLRGMVRSLKRDQQMPMPEVFEDNGAFRELYDRLKPSMELVNLWNPEDGSISRCTPELSARIKESFAALRKRKAAPTN